MAKAAGFTLGELARTLRATLEGDPAAVVTGVAPLESAGPGQISFLVDARFAEAARASGAGAFLAGPDVSGLPGPVLRVQDRKSTRLNSSHGYISYAGFCLKKKKI